MKNRNLRNEDFNCIDKWREDLLKECEQICDLWMIV